LILFFVVCLTIFGFINAQQSCSNYDGNCAACVANGCGFCAPDELCLSGSVSGPNQTHGNLSACFQDWVWGTCPACSQYQTCRFCKDVAGCEWCNGGCNAVGQATCYNNPNTCDCSLYPTCRQCGADPDCTFCSSNNTCIPIAAQKTCNVTNNYCPCSNNQFCFPCLEDFDCYWCEYNNQCVDSPRGCNLLAHQCPPPNCTQSVANCTSCLNTFGCNWCEDTGQCSSFHTNCSLIIHTCPTSTPRKFDAASFIGGGILGAGLFGIVGGIILCLVYNRKRRYEPIPQ